MKKTESVFHKPVYISMGIRDISKTLMYDFHYNYMEKKYGEKGVKKFVVDKSINFNDSKEC